MASEPYEILVGPSNLYVAAAKTVMPAVGSPPAAETWKLLGKKGNRNYTTDGATIAITQTVENVSVDGITLPFKSFRTEESATISCTILDMTVATLAQILDDATVKTVAEAKTSEIELERGSNLQEYSVLLRTASPYVDGQNAQFWFARAYQSGNQEVKLSGRAASEVAVEFTVMGSLEEGSGAATYIAETS